MNSKTGQPHPPPPIWEQPVPLCMAGQSDPKVKRSVPAAIGSIPRDELLRATLGIAEMLRPSRYMCRPSKHVTRPSRYYTRPSVIGYAKQNTDFYHQPPYPPPTNISLAPTAPQYHGMNPPTQWYELFSTPRRP
jgi:hypothetical protein